MTLADKKCVPCEGGVPPLSMDRAAAMLAEVPAWKIEGGKLRREIRLKDFRAAMEFLGRVADVAESEGHHPDFCVHYDRVDFTIWTHAIGGLSENDFILAAKIDALLE